MTQENEKTINELAKSLAKDYVNDMMGIATLETMKRGCKGFLFVSVGENYPDDGDDYFVALAGDVDELSAAVSMACLDNESMNLILRSGVSLADEFQNEDVPDFGIGEEESHD